MFRHWLSSILYYVAKTANIQVLASCNCFYEYSCFSRGRESLPSTPGIEFIKLNKRGWILPGYHVLNWGFTVWPVAHCHMLSYVIHKSKIRSENINVTVKVDPEFKQYIPTNGNACNKFNYFWIPVYLPILYTKHFKESRLIENFNMPPNWKRIKFYNFKVFSRKITFIYWIL